jgi:hypothetical protein
MLNNLLKTTNFFNQNLLRLNRIKKTEQLFNKNIKQSFASINPKVE